MKPTLALSIFLAISASALAQTPTVVEKPVTKTANVKAVPQTSAKPSPTNVKVVPAPAPKPTAAVKPAVISVAPVAKASAAQAPKTTIAATKTAAVQVSKTTAAAGKTAAVQPQKTPSQGKTQAVKVVSAPPVKAATSPARAVIAKPAAKPVKASPTAVAAKDPFNKQVPAVAVKGASTVVSVKDTKPATDKKPEPRKINAAGRRDPFISPVVNLGAIGSGCSSGKRCLAIDQIALKGVVKSDTGMIAVVVNAMDKAYFLRENDPVFNGYVVKITGDSIVFKETFKDKLGKPLTRDITKTISRPVA